MARGKYAEKSAKRQAELAVTSDLASYQHRVAKLTAENRELRERLAAQERTARQTERRLRAERDEGVAPQVEALRLALDAEKSTNRQTTGEFRRRVAAVLGEIIDRNKLELPPEDWTALMALLDVPAAALLNGKHNRYSRRTDAKLAERKLGYSARVRP